MKNLAFTQREKRITILAATVVFVYVFYLVVYIPIKKKGGALDHKIEQAKIQLNKELKVINRSKIFDKNYRDVLEEFRQKGSDEQIMSGILSEVENVAGIARVRISEKKPKKTKKIDFYNNFSVSLSLEGTLTDILHFLYILQNSPHLFNVDELNLTLSSSQGALLRCRLDLSRNLIP